MPRLQSPKSWRKLAPHTIESWLVSDNEHEQRLADEALQQLGAEDSINYLHQLLREDIRARKMLLWKVFAAGFVLMLCAGLWLRTVDIRLMGLAIFPMILANFAITTVSWMDTKLQKRIIEQCEKQLDVRMLPLIIEAAQSPQEVETGTRLRTKTLPTLFRQVTSETKHLISDSFWKIIVHSLKDAPQKTNSVPSELEYARAHIEVCGNTRHEPALPYLKAIAQMNATTPQSTELRQLAAGYVAAWHQPTVPVMEPVKKDEKVPLVAGKWYAS